jgi:hypothetical protein
MNRPARPASRKVGLQPIQRDGLEYEFDIVADMDGAKMIVSKTRFPDFNNKTFYQPAADIGSQIAAWLNTGAESAPKAQPAKVDTPPQDAPPPTPPAPATTYSGDRAKLWNLITASGVSAPAFLKALRKGKIVPISFTLSPDTPLLEQLTAEQISEAIAFFDTMFASK